MFLGLEEIGRAHDLAAAFVAINGQMGNFCVSSAVFAATLLSPAVVVPNHYGMYSDNHESPEKFAHHMRRQNPDQQVAILSPGVRCFLGKNGVV